MTQINQSLPTITFPRRKIFIARAFEAVTAMNLSVTYRHAVLGKSGGNGRPSSRPQFMRLYLAMNAHSFPMTEASRKAAEEQRQQRQAKHLRRQEERRVKHTVPAQLNEEQRSAWIENRKVMSRLRRQTLRSPVLAAQ